MPLPSRPRRLAAVVTAFAVGTTLALSALSASAEPAEPQAGPASEPGRYIVTMIGKPIATYDGAVKGLAATKPTKGKRVKVTSKRAKAYRSYLETQQDRVAARVGADADTHYAVSLNGFGTTLTPDQAKALKRAPGVLSVEKDKVRHLTNDQNPVDYLKLSGKNGVWAGLGGKAKAGRGIVVGVLDSGYWPESASFAGRPLGTKAPTKADPYRPYKVGSQIRMNKADGDTFVGACQPGEDAAGNFTGTECNSKVISARYYADGYKDNVPEEDRSVDYLSPRDAGGHGTHTASTAAGNAGIPATVEGRDFGKISGVAPAAKIAVYKVCWEARRRRLLHQRHPGRHRRRHHRRRRRDQLLDQQR